MIKRKIFLKYIIIAGMMQVLFSQHQQNLLQTDDLRHLISLCDCQVKIIRMVWAVSHVDLQPDGLIGQLRHVVLLAQMSQQDVL